MDVAGTTDLDDVNISADLDVDGTANLDGAVQIDNTVTVGVDDTGHDVRFYGATAGASWLWDESANAVVVTGVAGADSFNVAAGNVDIDGNMDVAGTTDLDDVNISADLDVDGTSNLDQVVIENNLQLGTQAITIPTSGDGNPAAYNLTPTSSFVQITCQDADTCDVTMIETGAQDGDVVFIVNMDTAVVDFADTAGVSELSGAFAMDQWDTLMLIYTSDRWVEFSRSGN